MAFELHLDRDGTRLTHSVGSKGCTIGRDPGSDLVVSDPLVSHSHARVWVEDDALRIRDLGSSNGTFVDDVPLVDETALEPGAELRVGDTRLVVHLTGADVLGATPSLVIEDVTTGVCVVLGSTRLTIGGAAGADLCVPGLPPRAATLVQYGGNEVWLGTGTVERELQIGETFEVAGRQFTLHPGNNLRAATQVTPAISHAYALHARLDGPTGPEAIVTDLHEGRSHRVNANNRAVLLYLLARRHVADGAAVPDVDRGWCSNDDVMTGIWGRTPARDNTLHVLVHRLRTELEEAGLDPWIIEKRRGFVRARLSESVVD